MLVIRRKSGQAIQITHGGESLLVKVSASEGRNVTLVVNGPESFRIERMDVTESSSSGSADCFVDTGGGRYRKGQVIGIAIDEAIVRIDGGEVVKVPKKQVTMVTKTAPPVDDS